MQFEKKHIFLLLVIFAAGLFLLFQVVFAGDVTVTDRITVVIPDNNITLYIEPGSSATTYQVSGQQLSVTTGPGDTTVIIQPQGFDMRNNLNLSATCNGPGGSGTEARLSVPPNSSLTITPTTNSYCGGTSSGVGGQPVPPPPPPPPPQPSRGSFVGGGVAELAPKLKITFTGKRKLSVSTEKTLRSILTTMIGKGTLKAPSQGELKVNPFNKTSADFGIRVALAIAGLSCGETIDSTQCRERATENGFLPDTKKRFLTRAAYYEILLKASGLPLLKKNEITKETLFTDVKATDKIAQVLATAKHYGIASRYSGNKSNANLLFSRYEAAVFADRTLKAMALARP